MDNNYSEIDILRYFHSMSKYVIISENVLLKPIETPEVLRSNRMLSTAGHNSEHNTDQLEVQCFQQRHLTMQFCVVASFSGL